MIFSSLLLISCDAKEKAAVMKAPEKFQNQLIHEKSPYLLQHADNPVNWYPWSDEAFEKARKEDKLVFLSIGYSTCHWCHVMEYESFEVVEVAEKINEYFVAIKVDREERPDIDNIYMSAVMAMTGRGGWPLTLILTPDRQPIFGGTYFPPYAKWGSPGLLDIMRSIHEAWTNNRQQLIQSGESLTQNLQARNLQKKGKAELSKTVLDKAFNQYVQMYDDQNGGFGRSPKFPTSHNLSLLLRYGHRTKKAKALEMVEHTLIQMAHGGMYDHLGGGFHRYSVDSQWRVPHFEKMLYDQAMLAKTYVETYQITKNEFYAQIAREILDYVLRDMQHAQGGFYSAEDADSLDPDDFAEMTPDLSQKLEKKEGSFYLWHEREIEKLLNKKEKEVFKRRYGVEPNGNVLSDPHGEFGDKNILYAAHSVEQTASALKISLEEAQRLINSAKSKLFMVRKNRPHPHLDDKVLVDWNGLMIASLSFGGRVLNEPRFIKAAEKSADFIIQNLITEKGRLLHRYRDGEASILGMIEDYAFFVHGLLELYEVTFHAAYLQKAIQLSEGIVDLFWDDAQKGFFFTAKDAEALLFKQKEIYDGAIPSGNSVTALNLARLYHLTLDKKWEAKLEEVFEVFADEIDRRPSAYAQMLIAFDYAIGPSLEIVIAGKKGSDGVSQLHDAVYKRYLPNRVILLRDDDDLKTVSAVAPFVENQTMIDKKPTVYLCQDHICKLPVNSLGKFQKQLDQLKFN